MLSLTMNLAGRGATCGRIEAAHCNWKDERTL